MIGNARRVKIYIKSRTLWVHGDGPEAALFGCRDPEFVAHGLGDKPIQPFEPVKLLQPGDIELVVSKCCLLLLPVDVALDLEDPGGDHLIVFVDLVVSSLALVQVVVVQERVPRLRGLYLQGIPRLVGRYLLELLIQGHIILESALLGF